MGNDIEIIHIRKKNNLLQLKTLLTMPVAAN